MNLGKRRITNADLCACFTGLGLRDVGAFLASGNVVFTGAGSPAALQTKIEAGLKAALDYEVPTYLRTADQVLALAKREPFADRDGAAARGKPQIVFLARAPSAKAAAAALAHDSDDDWLAIDGQELHWWPRGRLSESALDLKALAKALGEPTIRTRNTIVRLVAKHFS